MINVNVEIEKIVRLSKGGNEYEFFLVSLIFPGGEIVRIEDFSLKGFEECVSFSGVLLKDSNGRYSVDGGYFIPWQYSFAIGYLYNKYLEKGV